MELQEEVGKSSWNKELQTGAAKRNSCEKGLQKGGEPEKVAKRSRKRTIRTTTTTAKQEMQQKTAYVGSPC